MVSQILKKILIIFLVSELSSSKVIIFDLSLQSQLQDTNYQLKQNTWSITFWFQLTQRVANTQHLIFTFLNDLGQITKFILNSHDILQIQNVLGVYNDIYKIEQFSEYNDQILFSNKTYKQKWIKGGLNYQSQKFQVFIKDQYVEVDSFNYDGDYNGQINFFSIEQNCQVLWSNFQLHDQFITYQNFIDKLKETGLIGFYFFEFVSRNRQTVENLSTYTRQPIFIQEYNNVPTKFFDTYGTQNVFSSFKLTFSNFWSSVVFYSLKMHMSFSLIFKDNIKEIFQQINLESILYQRNFQYSDMDQQQNSLQTKLILNFLLTQDQNLKSNYAFQNFFVFLIHSQEIQKEQIMMLNNIDNQSYIYNFIYYMHLKTNYDEQQQNQNLFIFELNELQFQHTENFLYFSKLDQHFTYFNNQSSSNYYFVVVIQEIIFYRDDFVQQDNKFIDKFEEITRNCNLDNSEPFFQERFLINANNQPVMGNCQRLKRFQRCDKYFKCIRCTSDSCILCANDYYLQNGKCIKCNFPFMIIDYQCMMSSKIFEFQIINSPNNQLSQYFTYLQNNLYEQNYIQFKILDVNYQVIERVESFLINSNQQYQGQQYENNLINYFQNIIQNEQYYLQISIMFTNLIVKKLNIYKTFQCLTFIQPNTQDLLFCEQNCFNNFFSQNQQQLCEDNLQGCLRDPNQSQDLCFMCKGGYELTQNFELQIQYCLSKNPNQTQQNKANNQNVFDKNVYTNNQYTISSQIFEICNVEQGYYQIDSLGCQLISVNQIELCTQLSQQGNCLVSNDNIFATGYIYDSNGDVFYYFDLNKQDFQINNCQQQINFDLQIHIIEFVEDKCVWQDHLDTNNILQNCLLFDQNCQKCQQQDVNYCDQCLLGELIQFDYYNICGRKIPNCYIHTWYDAKLICEICQQGYQIVKYYAPSSIIGLCILESVQNCREYELLLDDSIECIQCQNKYQRAFDINRICVYYKYYAEHCTYYKLDSNNMYQCSMCAENSICLNSEGNIIDDLNQENFVCYNCLPNDSLLQHCFSYNKNYSCNQCQFNYLLYPENQCVTFCAQFESQISYNCIECMQGYVLQNFQCYQFIQFCIQYDSKGCSVCSFGYRIFYQQDILKNICVQHIQYCDLYSLINDLECQQCDIGYRRFQIFQNYDQCIKNIENCTNYSNTSIYQCLECVQGFRIFQNENFFDKCYINIPNCIIYDKNNYLNCTQCQENYQLANQNQKCIEKIIIEAQILNLQNYDCLNQIKNCLTCQENNCIECNPGYKILFNVCEKIYDIDLSLDLQKICTIKHQNCLKCIFVNSLKCVQCNEGYQFYNDYECISLDNSKNDQQNLNYGNSFQCLQYKQDICIKCIDPFILRNDKCMLIDIPDQLQLIQDQIRNNCKDQTLCFKREEKINQNCQKCKNICKFQIEQNFNKFYLFSDNQISYQYYHKINDKFELTTSPEVYKIEIQLTQLFNKQVNLFFYSKNLIQRTMNCTPKDFYYYDIQNHLVNFKSIGKNKTQVTNLTLGGVFNVLQIAFPQWTISYFINSIQKLDTLGYLSYSNLYGGQLYNFINAFPEDQISQIQLNQKNDKEYLFQFILNQNQLDCFNIINHSSIFTIMIFIIYMIFNFFYVIIKNIKSNYKVIIRKLLEKLKYEFYIQQKSLIMILSIYIIPKINRSFLIRNSISSVQTFMIFSIDFIICYYALKKNYNHLNFERFMGTKEEKNIYRIFNKEQDSLSNYENQFNVLIALNFLFCIIQGYILYLFQDLFQFSFIITNILSLFMIIYLIKSYRQKEIAFKLMYINHIFSEILFILFTSKMLIYYFTNYKSNLILNILYILLNISKFMEGFIIMRTIRKLKKEKQYKIKALNLNQLQSQKTQIIYTNGLRIRFKSKMDLSNRIKSRKKEQVDHYATFHGQ